MDGLFGVDAAHILWWQMSLRAIVVFLAGVVLIRLAGARTFARGSPIDIVVAVILGSNLSRAITGSVQLFPTLLASAVIVGVHAVLIRSTLLSHPLALLLKGRPAILLEDGVAKGEVLRREGISKGDWEELLRAAGVVDPSEVRLAVRERSGGVSVLKRTKEVRATPEPDARPTGRLEGAAREQADTRSGGEGKAVDPDPRT